MRGRRGCGVWGIPIEKRICVAHNLHVDVLEIIMSFRKVAPQIGKVNPSALPFKIRATQIGPRCIRIPRQLHCPLTYLPTIQLRELSFFFFFEIAPFFAPGSGAPLAINVSTTNNSYVAVLEKGSGNFLVSSFALGTGRAAPDGCAGNRTHDHSLERRTPYHWATETRASHRMWGP